MIPHESVLLNEFLSFFAGKRIVRYLDGTVGAGGHLHALLQVHPEVELAIAMDRDEDALEIAKKRVQNDTDRVKFVHANYRMIKTYAEGPLDGIFLDLGVSSMQLDQAERGFSFNKEGPLDMRMDPSRDLSAADVVNTFPEKELADLFWTYGEESRSRRAAKAIVEARKKKKIKTTSDLVSILSPVLTWGGRRRKHIHPLTLVFQALRIYVNDELGALSQGITDALDLLAPGGRFGVISFQSLEDRIVKEAFRTFVREKKGILLTKKPIIPSDEECRRNPRSRSAKMRFVEKG